MEQVKETAVEWLVDVLSKYDSKMIELFNKEIEQAKEMEKEQIVNTYRDGRSDQQSEKPSRFYNRWAELYYYEQYGG
jgi:3-dehydroquinate dehydratase